MTWLRSSIFLLLVLTFAPLAANALSPHEQLNQLVQELSTNPNDTALRERIIKLAQEINPPPAIPEEARRHFIQATAIAKTATNAAGQGLAIQSYREALKLAPWWGDAYYNLAVSLQLAGQLAEAKQSLKFYIMSKPSEKDLREAQDRIYAIEGQERLAQTPATPQNSPQAIATTEQQFLQSLEGGVWRGPVSRWDDSAFATTHRIEFIRTYYTVRSHQLVHIQYSWFDQEPEPPPPTCYSSNPPRCQVLDTIPLTGKRIDFKTSEGWRFSVQISEDGRRITHTKEGYGKVLSTEYVRAN